jgi:two-component system phosphate regulon sensor histidine kinase PhoR
VRDVRARAARVDAQGFVALPTSFALPLTVISGYDTLADDPALDPAWEMPVQEMRRQADRMRRIVQDLLDLSKLEARTGDAENSPVDVSGMLALMRKDVLGRPECPVTVDLSLDSDALLLGSESERTDLANLI